MKDPYRARATADLYNARRRAARAIKSMRKTASLPAFRRTEHAKELRKQAKNLQAFLKNSTARGKGWSIERIYERVADLEARSSVAQTIRSNRLTEWELARARSGDETALFSKGIFKGADSSSVVSAFYMAYKPAWEGAESVADRNNLILRAAGKTSLREVFEDWYTGEDRVVSAYKTFSGANYADIDTDDPEFRDKMMEDYSSWDSKTLNLFWSHYYAMR